MRIEKTTSIKLTEEEKDVLRKADCIIGDMFFELNKESCCKVILPPVIECIRNTINELSRFEYRSDKNEEGRG